MPTPLGKKKKVMGEKLMRRNGLKKVTVWLDSYETRLITEAAEHLSAPIATYVRQMAVAAAEKSRAKVRRRSLPLR
jgi:hypothetical protein